MTPAQANAARLDFINSWPVQGPTDPGIRAADCWYAKNMLPAQPACADCKGPIPMWTHTAISPVRGPSAGIGEQVMLGRHGALGFALGAAGDPDVWTKLSTAQQTWVMNTLMALNNMIYQSTNTTCPTFGPSITAAGGCFQSWFNANSKLTNPDGTPVKLRTDGVFDQDTLNALTTTAAMDPQHFPTAFPAGAVTSAAPTAASASTGVSTAKMVGIAGLGAAGIGAILWAATSGHRHGKKRRRRR